MEFPDGFVAEPERLHRPWAEVFGDGVEAGHKPADEVAAGRALEIDRDGAFVAIEVEEVPAVHRAGGSAAAGLAQARRLDLHNVGPEPGKRLRC